MSAPPPRTEATSAVERALRHAACFSASTHRIDAESLAPEAAEGRAALADRRAARVLAPRALAPGLRALKSEASRRFREAKIDVTRRTRRRPVRPGPVTVAGFFEDPRGVARGAQLGADALTRLGFDVVRHDLSPLLHADTPAPPPEPGGALILHANPPELRVLLSKWPASAWRDRHCVGFWVWELERAPDSWRAAAGWVDEIWAPSRFAAAAFAEWDAPVRVMPHPVPAASAGKDRARFALPEDKPVALTAFDFRSTLARKNPDGAITAFIRAVDASGIDALLVVKALAPKADPEGWKALRRQARDRDDIRFMTEPLDDAAMASLIASVDVLISLHRSEGFGLLLAEAMRAGVPVVTTAWSAPLEYIPETAAALTPCRLVTVGDPSGHYSVPDARWADPDIDAAAARIRLLLSDPARRASLGEAGRRAIAEAQAAAYRQDDLSADFLAAVARSAEPTPVGGFRSRQLANDDAERAKGDARAPPALGDEERRKPAPAPATEPRPAPTRPEATPAASSLLGTSVPMTSAVAHFESYAAKLSSLVAAFDWRALAPLAAELADCARTRRQVFVCGNGGSAGNACHLSNDLIYSAAKRSGHALRAHALTANPAVLTCLANDVGYERIFELQLRELADAGDVLIAYSGSGDSANVVKALEAARDIGMRSYAVLGFSGGRCKPLADHAIHFPIDDMQIAEDMQLVIGHMLTQWLWENRAALATARDAA